MAVGNSGVTVLGHSLGSALGTYLTAELAGRFANIPLSACLFASPKPGDGDFAKDFDGKVRNYIVYNYEEDLVPDAPPIGFSALSNCVILRQQETSPSIGDDKACCHHLISYIALLSADEFKRVIALQGTTHDDCKCAACVTLKPA